MKYDYPYSVTQYKLTILRSDFRASSFCSVKEIEMIRTSVSSSNLASVGYDSIAQTLEVEFNHGGIYQYSGVPSSVYSGLMAASSHGQYFDRYVKKAGYSYKKIG